MSFIPVSPGTGVEHSELINVIVGNSITMSVGELVKLDTTAGFATNGTAGIAVFGICVGFQDASGKPLSPSAYVPGTATGSDVQTFVAASDNQTVAKTVAIIDASRSKKYSAQVNGTMNTTVNSNRIGARVDVDSADSHYDRVLETTATRTDSTIANFFSYGVDPNDSTRMIVSISASQYMPKAG